MMVIESVPAACGEIANQILTKVLERISLNGNMNRALFSCAAGLYLLGSVLLPCAAAQAPHNYEKGTVTETVSGKSKGYDLKAPNGVYQISHCGDLQSGQSVDFRADEDNVYILRDGGKEYRCSIKATIGNANETPHAYQHGTISGWGNVYRYWTDPRPAIPSRERYFTLRGPDAAYHILNCGSFAIGQSVDYRVDGEKAYIDLKNGQESQCEIDSVEMIGNGGEAAPPAKP
jgi:hypothetical protein